MSPASGPEDPSTAKSEVSHTSTGKQDQLSCCKTTHKHTQTSPQRHGRAQGAGTLFWVVGRCNGHALYPCRQLRASNLSAGARLRA